MPVVIIKSEFEIFWHLVQNKIYNIMESGAKKSHLKLYKYHIKKMFTCLYY